MQKDFSIKFKNEKGNNYIPIENIRELYCFNDITFSTKFLGMLSKAGVIVHYFDYYENYIGTFYPKEYLVSGSLLVKQALAYETKRLIIARAIVNGIAKNIYEVLYHYYRHGKQELKEYIQWLRRKVPTLLDKANTINQIMMVEGTIWARFYNSFKVFLPEEFIMNKRVKRPPDNPMNALISFGNTMLYTKTITQIYHTHLNQQISYLHASTEGRFSLCLDLCEVFKPIIVFKTIFDCVNNRKLSVEKHFVKDYNYCLLNEEGRKIFVKEFDNRINQVFVHAKLKRKVSYRHAIQLDGYKLIKYLMENQPFVPFSMEEKQ